MKQPRRWAVVLAALLMAASLIFAPREGSAGPAGGRSILPGEPRPTPEMGGPEMPPDPGPLVSCRVWLSSVLLARGLQVDLVVVVEAPKSPSGTRLARCTPRPAAKP